MKTARPVRLSPQQRHALAAVIAGEGRTFHALGASIRTLQSIEDKGLLASQANPVATRWFSTSLGRETNAALG